MQLLQRPVYQSSKLRIIILTSLLCILYLIDELEINLILIYKRPGYKFSHRVMKHVDDVMN